MLVKLVVRTPRKHSELVSELLFQAGAGGIEELDRARRLVVYTETRERAQQIAERARALLNEALPRPSGIALDVVVDERSDWASAWTQYLRPIALTPKLVIQPAWDATGAPPGMQRIWFDPKLSFGDGAHATTRLASLALERACQERAPLSVLDFGSGTGVLCFVALLSGASSAWGVDIDPVSVASARHNAALNGFGERARFVLPAELGADPFDLVVANLEAEALLACAAELSIRAAQAERLILTGFLRAREAEIAAAFAAQYVLDRAACESDWLLLELLPRH